MRLPRSGALIKLAAAVAFSVLLSSFPVDAFIPITSLLTMLWLALLLPERINFILGAGSIIELLVAARSTGIAHYQVILADVPATWLFLSGGGQPAPAGWPNLAARVAGFLGFSMVAWLFLNRSSRRMRGLALPVSLLILLALLAVFGAVKDARPLWAYFLLLLALLWIKFMWGFLLALNMGLGYRPFPLRQMWSLSPVWKFDVLPNWVPSRIDLAPAEGPSRRAEKLDFLILTAMLAVVAWAYHFAAPGYYRIFPTLIGSGSILFLERVPGVAQAWMIMLGDFSVFFLFNLGVVLSIAFLFLELVGIPAYTSISSPQRSRSLHEFNTRILRFYVQMITQVAYAPFAALLSRFLKYGKLRVFLGTFLSVLALGTLYHFLSFIHLVAILGLGETFRLYLLDQFPYVFLFAIAAAGSVALAMRRRPAPLPWWQHGLRLALIVVFNSLLLSLAFNSLVDEGSWRLRVVKYLFTGIR